MRFIFRTLVRWAVLAVAVWLTTELLSGVHVDGGWKQIFAVALAFGLIDLVVGGVLRVLGAPVIWLTLGIALLFINTLCIYITTWVYDKFTVDGFWWALGAGFIITLVANILDAAVLPKRKREER